MARLVCVAVLILSGAAVPRAVPQPASAAPSQARPAPPVMPPVMNDETKRVILDLKRQADAAKRADNTARAKLLYQQILAHDPDDPLARQELDKIEAKEHADKRAVEERRLSEIDAQAKLRRAQAMVAEAERLVYEARASGRTELLKTAEERLTSAGQQQPAPPDLARVQRLVDDEQRAVRIRKYELWGFIALIVVAIAVPIVLAVWRPRRVLEMLDGPEPGLVFALQKPSTRLGALAADVDHTIADPLRKISRHHCDIVRHGRHYFVVDHSTNGTQLNGRPLPKSEPVLLKRGDRLGLSSDVMLLFR